VYSSKNTTVEALDKGALPSPALNTTRFPDVNCAYPISFIPNNKTAQKQMATSVNLFIIFIFLRVY
jgi:hypothetical protein